MCMHVLIGDLYSLKLNHQESCNNNNNFEGHTAFQVYTLITLQSLLASTACIPSDIKCNVHTSTACIYTK